MKTFIFHLCIFTTGSDDVWYEFLTVEADCITSATDKAEAMANALYGIHNWNFDSYSNGG